MAHDTGREIFSLALLLLLSAPDVLAHRAPSDDGGRPQSFPAGIESGGDVLDPVEDGWINRASGVLAALIHQDAGPYTGTPEAAARAYLADHAAPFGLSRAGGDLLLDRVQTSPAGMHVRFHQTVGGLRTWRADLVVSVDPTAGRIHAVHSRYDPILAHTALSTSPLVDATTARRAAIGAVGVAGEPSWIGEPTEALWVVREQDRVGSPPHLAWRVLLPLAEPMGEWEVFVDAIDSSILRLRDQMVYAAGTGAVFDPDPLTTAETTYGGNYADNGDDDTSELNAERVLRTLPDLKLDGGVYHLDGPFVKLIDFESPWGDPATEADPDDFVYTRSEQGFEDVMCYYVLDASQRHIQSLGFYDVQNGPIECDPHGLGGGDNSHYLPGQNRLAYGEGGVDDGEDADVILHEYAHALQYGIVPNWGGGQQLAMGEGVGDYWAGSYSASLSLHDCNWVFNWDGHNDFWPGRVLNSTKHYPEDYLGDIYADGEIWSAPWVQIYFECGRTVTDTDMLLHLYYQGGSATMPEAAIFAMQADLDFYGGLHAGSLNEYFTERGFFAPGQFDVPVLTHEPIGDQTTAGPYPITVTIESVSEITMWSVRARYGTGDVFDHQALLEPSGNPNEYIGELPNGGGDVDIRYYIHATNEEGWKGVHPRGAEFQYHQYHVGPLVAVQETQCDAGLALLPAEPNPFVSSTTFRFTLPRDGEVRLTIHDLAGRTVRTLAKRDLAAGAHVFPWDGRDDAARLMPAGLYLARLEDEKQRRSQRILLIR